MDAMTSKSSSAAYNYYVMTLDPRLVPVLEIDAARPRLEMPVTEARVRSSEFQQRIRDAYYRRGPEPAAILDLQLPVEGAEIPLRCYRPEGEGPFPVHVYLHGGGFWLGSIEGSDISCREICVASGALVVSVGYRLAPEHRFPIPAEDCYAALCWVAEHASQLGGEPAIISVGGESAGGNLAAVVALMARDRRGPEISLQVLSVAVTDLTGSQPSVEEFAEGYLLSRAGMRTQREHYLGGSVDPRHPYVSPLFSPDLCGLPPALVVTMEFDPHRDEAEAYARRLVEAGVVTVQRRFLGHVHGSAMFTALLPETGYYNFLAGVMRAAYAAHRGYCSVGSALKRLPQTNRVTSK
jgi:acetyl esterase